MYTVRDIVFRAMRMAGILGRTEEADAEEMRDGRIVLQSLYDSWYTNGMFGRLKDYRTEGDYDAEPGQRIYTDGTVTLPTYADAECPWSDLSAIEIFDGTSRKLWLWDRNAWVRIDALADGDEAPLSWRGANGLAACVAVNYAEEFGAQIGPGAVRQAGTFKTALSLKLGSTQPVTAGEWF